METSTEYFERKYAELRLINESLEQPIDLNIPQSVEEVVKLKFRLTAELRAAHERSAWRTTETSWSNGVKSNGPFQFHYDYQRADLSVRGPDFYDASEFPMSEPEYTGSGMAAISAALIAISRLFGETTIIAQPNSYAETIEFLKSYGEKLNLNLWDKAKAVQGLQVFLLDSSVPSGAFYAALNQHAAPIDLLLFDTTCLASTSGRIRQALRWALRQRIPVVMVRSHTKLDSLGAEYGRLGSLAVMAGETTDQLAELANEIKQAVRLFGGAALPAHFPPYAGSKEFERLTRLRMAKTVRNNRLAVQLLISAGVPALDRACGLYAILTGSFDERTARKAAERMSNELRAKGLPLRHAGSFGFDFAATEWCRNADTDQYAVRVALSDMPDTICKQLVEAIAGWWGRN